MRRTTDRGPFKTTIGKDHRIVDGPTVHTSHTFHSPELLFTETGDGTIPGLDHQEPTTSCADHKSSCSALVESRGRCSRVRRRSDASAKPYSHAGPSAEWELTQNAQFEKLMRLGQYQQRPGQPLLARVEEWIHHVLGSRLPAESSHRNRAPRSIRYGEQM